MQEVLSVVHTVFLLDRVLDTVHTVALTGGRPGRRSLFLHAHRRSPVICTSPSVCKTRGIAVEEEDDFLEAGLELWVDESVYDGVDCGMAEKEPVEGYLQVRVYCREFFEGLRVEKDVEGTAPDR